MSDVAADPAPEITGEQPTDAPSEPIETAPEPEQVAEEAPEADAAEEEAPEDVEPQDEAPVEAPEPTTEEPAVEEASVKRKLEDESEQPVTKRMNNGDEMNETSMPVDTVDISAGDLPPDSTDASGQVTGYISCPEALVSKLIGKKGAVIQTLESTSGCKIQVEHQKPGDPKHVRIIAKTQEELDSTKKLIKDTLESENPLGEVTRAVDCPQDMVGRIIGRAGQTIQALQQASNAQIHVDQDAAKFPEGAPRQIRIVGMAPCVERAEKMVVELMSAEQGVTAQSVIQKYGIGNSKTMSCPKSMVGRVIGKQGETIKNLQRLSGANIQIDQKSDPCTITITGHNNSISNAMREINMIINEPMGFNQRGMGGGGGGGGGGYGGYPGGFPAQQSGYAHWNGYQQHQGYPDPGYGQYGQANFSGYQQPQAYQTYQGAPGYGQQGGYQQGGYGQPPQGGMAAHGWTEEYDPASQRYYYYNSITGVTQWDKPQEMG